MFVASGFTFLSFLPPRQSSAKFSQERVIFLSGRRGFGRRGLRRGRGLLWRGSHRRDSDGIQFNPGPFVPSRPNFSGRYVETKLSREVKLTRGKKKKKLRPLPKAETEFQTFSPRGAIGPSSAEENRERGREERPGFGESLLRSDLQGPESSGAGSELHKSHLLG